MYSTVSVIPAGRADATPGAPCTVAQAWGMLTARSQHGTLFHLGAPAQDWYSHQQSSTRSLTCTHDRMQGFLARRVLPGTKLAENPAGREELQAMLSERRVSRAGTMARAPEGTSHCRTNEQQPQPIMTGRFSETTGCAATRCSKPSVRVSSHGEFA